MVYLTLQTAALIFGIFFIGAFIGYLLHVIVNALFGSKKYRPQVAETLASGASAKDLELFTKTGQKLPMDSQSVSGAAVSAQTASKGGIGDVVSAGTAAVAVGGAAIAGKAIASSIVPEQGIDVDADTLTTQTATTQTAATVSADRDVISARTVEKSVARPLTDGKVGSVASNTAQGGLGGDQTLAYDAETDLIPRDEVGSSFFERWFGGKPKAEDLQSINDRRVAAVNKVETESTDSIAASDELKLHETSYVPQEKAGSSFFGRLFGGGAPIAVSDTLKEAKSLVDSKAVAGAGVAAIATTAVAATVGSAKEALAEKSKILTPKADPVSLDATAASSDGSDIIKKAEGIVADAKGSVANKVDKVDPIASGKAIIAEAVDPDGQKKGVVETQTVSGGAADAISKAEEKVEVVEVASTTTLDASVDSPVVSKVAEVAQKPAEIVTEASTVSAATQTVAESVKTEAVADTVKGAAVAAAGTVGAVATATAMVPEVVKSILPMPADEFDITEIAETVTDIVKGKVKG